MDECPECRELESRINKRITAKDEATRQFSDAMQRLDAIGESRSRQELAAKAYEAEIELRVLYEIQVLHELLLHSDPN